MFEDLSAYVELTAHLASLMVSNAIAAKSAAIKVYNQAHIAHETAAKYAKARPNDLRALTLAKATARTLGKAESAYNGAAAFLVEAESAASTARGARPDHSAILETLSEEIPV